MDNPLPFVPASLAPYAFADRYRVPLRRDPPVLDGRVEPGEWAVAARLDGFPAGIDGEAESLSRRRAEAWIAATPTHFHFAVVSELPPPPAALVAEQDADSVFVGRDDAVEVWIDPDPDAEEGATYQFLLNALGRAGYLAHPRGRADVNRYYGWQGGYRWAQGFHDGAWHVEVEVPVEAVAPGRRAGDGVWAVNLCRSWKQPWAWSHLGSRGAYNPRRSVRVSFHDRDALAVQVRHEAALPGRRLDTVLSLHNPFDRPAEAHVQLYLARDKQSEVRLDERVAVPPGGTAERRLRVPADPVSGAFSLFALVRGAGREDGPFDYARCLRWTPREGPRWDARTLADTPRFLFAYYPGLDRLHVRAFAGDLLGRPAFRALAFEVLRRADGRKAAGFRLPREGFDAGGFRERTVRLPPLEGGYEIVCRVRGRGLDPQPVRRAFERRRFEWEGNTLGARRAVYPPFEPIRRRGRTLEVVLRAYRFGALGLPEQIEADERRAHRHPPPARRTAPPARAVRRRRGRAARRAAAHRPRRGRPRADPLPLRARPAGGPDRRDPGRGRDAAGRPRARRRRRVAHRRVARPRAAPALGGRHAPARAHRRRAASPSSPTRSPRARASSGTPRGSRPGACRETSAPTAGSATPTAGSPGSRRTTAAGDGTPAGRTSRSPARGTGSSCASTS